jgi:hypothetical protein
MKTRKAKLEEIRLNFDGDELIYETPGDEQRGNPLDIIKVVECFSAEDVTGLRFDAKEVAERIVRCWDTHERLIAFVEMLIEMCDASGKNADSRGEAAARGREAG